MPRTLRSILAMLVAVFALGGAAAYAETPSAFGIWKNPKDSVHVELRPCGDGACGYVVWASEKAQAAARKGGTQNLIGLQLFREMVLDKDGAWKGRVFVPDLNRTFAGRAEALDAQTLRAKGCFAGVVCKSQIWTRAG